MAPMEAEERFWHVPEGYVPVPLSEDQVEAPVRLCVLARREADPTSGWFVLLRDFFDGQVFLGCVVDAEGHLLQWLEVWVQNVGGLGEVVSACRGTLSNDSLDERWKSYFRGLQQLPEGGVIATGWERKHPFPTLVDVEEGRPRHPLHAATAERWELCRTDALLAARELPPYSTSVHRYLHVPMLGEESPLVPVTPEAPVADGCWTMEQATNSRKGLVPFNPAAGLMLVRTHNPVQFEQFVDVLGGQTWEGIFHGHACLDLGGAETLLKQDSVQGRLHTSFLATRGKSGRLAEGYHLKLRLFTQLVKAVRGFVLEQKRPVLGLSPESFQVRLAGWPDGFPLLWTAQAVLADPGEAFPFSVADGSEEYFLRLGTAAGSIYRPVTARAPTAGRGRVRIRRVVDGDSNEVAIEGTLVAQERLEAGANDLISFRLNLGSRPLDFYAHPDEVSALAQGECRFGTIARPLNAELVQALKAAAGMPFPNVPFQVLPVVSTPCDLFALAVLAVRILLVDGETSLPIAMDELLSLARQVALEHDENENLDLPARVGRIFERDERWLPSVGPQRLTYDEVSPADALAAISARLWWETLAVMIRMFPGMGPDSECRDLGDVPAGRPHQVFDRTLAALDPLLVRSRSLIVMDPQADREIQVVIGRCLKALSDG